MLIILLVMLGIQNDFAVGLLPQHGEGWQLRLKRGVVGAGTMTLTDAKGFYEGNQR